jgi:hypothetical protein
MASPCGHFKLPHGFRVGVMNVLRHCAQVTQHSGRKSEAPVENSPALLNATNQGERLLPGNFGGEADRLVLADSVEKLVFRSCSKGYRPADASLVLGRGGPCDLLLRSTKRLLTNASTIRRANCQLQGAHARIRAHRNLEFFNRIGRTEALEIGLMKNFKR